MLHRYRNFIRGLSVNWFGRLGVVLTTSSFISFLFLEMLRLAGVLTNAYIGLITYLLFPALFAAGLVLIPIGWWKYRRQRQQTTRELLAQRFDETEVRPAAWGSRLLVTVLGLTLINILFMIGASMRMLEFMDQPVFCGTACHTVMNPEWTTYQVSPHARVRCVDCHVGEGVDALIDSKLNGLRQMFLATFDAYNRPIPTPVHQLRPARETCEKCHWPEKFYGHRFLVNVQYALDEASTPRYTTLLLKIDTGQTATGAGIHWHVGAHNVVRYASVNDQREQMIWVEARQPDGTFRRYENRRLDASPADAANVRVMDCVDCHNRATHIYERPEAAVDERIRRGLIDRSLPFVKREVLAAITNDYPDPDAAMTGIARHLEGFYQRNYPQTSFRQLDLIHQAVAAAQDIHRRNIHHHMRIDWNAYPGFIGHHRPGGGCFRCHNPDLQDAAGRFVSDDCVLCHSIVAFGDERPFQYLAEPAEDDPRRPMHEYLRQEFLRFSRR